MEVALFRPSVLNRRESRGEGNEKFPSQEQFLPNFISHCEELTMYMINVENLFQFPPLRARFKIY